MWAICAELRINEFLYNYILAIEKGLIFNIGLSFTSFLANLDDCRH